MYVILALAVALMLGLLSTRLTRIIGLPNITGYLLAGIVVGPYVLGLFLKDSAGNVLFDFSSEIIDEIVNIALGFIAFSIGSSFKLKHMKELGKSVVTITFVQALATCLLVDAVLIAVAAISKEAVITYPAAIILGAIATATAPAATLLVVRQYKAKGVVTNTLLPVVAFDDAIGLVIFSISFAIARVFVSGDPIVAWTFIKPILEILASLGIGSVLGVALHYASLWFKSRANRICLIIMCTFFSVALSQIFNSLNFEVSSLLVCMMLGAVYCNLNKESDKMLDIMDRWTYPLFMLFFVISGADLNFAVIPQIGIIGVVYILVRAMGKYGGAFVGASLVKADKNVRDYLGLALFPQAGVAIGMALIVQSSLGASTVYNSADIVAQITTIVLCATIVYELVGPVITKWALRKSGEIELPPKKQKEPTPTK